MSAARATAHSVSTATEEMQSAASSHTIILWPVVDAVKPRGKEPCEHVDSVQLRASARARARLAVLGSSACSPRASIVLASPGVSAFVPQALRGAARGRRTIWLHAVSVGEIIAAARLVAELERALPEHCICISTTTCTGYTLALAAVWP